MTMAETDVLIVGSGHPHLVPLPGQDGARRVGEPAVPWESPCRNTGTTTRSDARCSSVSRQWHWTAFQIVPTLQ